MEILKITDYFFINEVNSAIQIQQNVTRKN